MKFGLLGKHLSHSYSAIIHNSLYRFKGIDANYELIEVDETSLPLMIEKLKNGDYQGFNVTIPYKIEIMKYLDVISHEALKIGSVNTVALIDGKAVGFNTDYYGFLDTININKIDVLNKNCYVLGTGGASLAISRVLNDLGGIVTFVSRNKQNKENTIDYNDLDFISHIDLIVNTTPVGMYPNINDCPLNDDIIKRTKVIIDIIFNPTKTELLKRANLGYNGLYMLVSQAVKSEEIWQQRDFTNVCDYLMNKVKEEI